IRHDGRHWEDTKDDMGWAGGRRAPNPTTPRHLRTALAPNNAEHHTGRYNSTSHAPQASRKRKRASPSDYMGKLVPQRLLKRLKAMPSVGLGRRWRKPNKTHLFEARRLVITRSPALMLCGKVQNRQGVIHITAEALEPL